MLSQLSDDDHFRLQTFRLISKNNLYQFISSVSLFLYTYRSVQGSGNEIHCTL